MENQYQRTAMQPHLTICLLDSYKYVYEYINIQNFKVCGRRPYTLRVSRKSGYNVRTRRFRNIHKQRIGEQRRGTACTLQSVEQHFLHVVVDEGFIKHCRVAHAPLWECCSDEVDPSFVS